MARCFIFIIVLLLVLNCTTNNTPNIVFKRSFKANTTTKLTVNKTIQQQTTFNYYNKEVTNLAVKYFKRKNKLVINSDTFFITNKRYTHQNLQFKMYQHKTDSTAVKTLVFNKNYGLLAVIGLANDAVFLKDSLSVFKNEAVFKDILLAFNKIEQ